MSDLRNPYQRLERIFISIESLKQSNKREDSRISVKELAIHSGISMEILRSDLSCILDVADDEYELVIDDEYVSDIYDDRHKFKRDLLSGKLDDAEIEYFTTNDNVLLPLTGEESSIMEHILREHHNGKKAKSQPFVVKDSYHFSFIDEEKINDTLYNIRSAILRNIEIKIRDEKGHEISIRPVRIFYDATENLYAVISLDEDGLGAYRIDMIEYLGDGEKFEMPEDLEKRLKIIPNIWGLDFRAKPMRVRVKIYASHGRGNVGKSVKKDLECRTNGKLFEMGDFLIYEDIVYGKEAFLRWIFGYGNSVVVEKPESLRKEIIRIVKAELEKNK